MNTALSILAAVIVSFIAAAFVKGSMQAFNRHMPAIIQAAKEDKPGAWVRSQTLIFLFLITWIACIYGVYRLWDWALTVG